MKSKFGKVLRGSFFMALLALFFMLPGCPVTETPLLVDGSAYDVELQVQDDGTLYAVEIEPSDDGEQDGEQDGENDEQEGENEDGEDGEDVEQEGENEDEDGEQDGENEDGEDGEEVDTGFSVQVDSVAAGCSSFTVFGSLMVVLEEGEDDGENVEQEGENEGENRGDRETLMYLGVGSQEHDAVGPALGRDGEREDGEQREDGEDGEDGEEDLGICDLTAGVWIEAEGEYEADGIFYAKKIELADEAESEIESVILNVTDGTFTMLGLTITYDEDTIIEGGDEEGENEDEGEADEDEGDGEDGDDDCEQEGENEGENAGC